MKMKQKGLTLIELLVVIAIIGLLVTIVLVAVQNARAKGRDAQRIQQLQQLRAALQLYYEDNGEYPIFCPLAVTTWCVSTEDRDAGTPGIQWMYTDFLDDYLSEDPLDPINNNPYRMTEECQGCTGYLSCPQCLEGWEYRIIVHGASPSPGWGQEFILTAPLETPHSELPKVLNPSSGLENWYPLDCRDAFPQAVDCVVYEEL